MKCLSIDWREPLAAIAPLAGAPFAHLFSGGRQAGHSWGGEWRTLLADPAETLVLQDGALYRTGERIEMAGGRDPLAVLGTMLAERQREDDTVPPALCADGLAPPAFLTGAAGYIGYEAARYLEPVLAGLPPAPGGLPDMAIGFYDAAALFHEGSRQAFVVGRSDAAATALAARLGTGDDAPETAAIATMVPQPNAEEAFAAAVAACRERILDGTIFQANITRQLTALYQGADWRAFSAPLFARLQAESAAPFGALLQFEEGCVLSDSPERFLSIAPQADGLRVMAEPVKGTRPRSADRAADAAIRAELAHDEKDRAENVMIADLTRNDLSRICRDHSVREEAICDLQSFGHVHHLVSRISGVLTDENGAAAALSACFPCGSITGAPKIAAMKVIADLEQAGRGVYCGAIGLFDDGGAAEISVPIRTATLEPDDQGARLRYGTGGGITVLSDPQAEYRETETKAGPFRRLSGIAGAPAGVPAS